MRFISLGRYLANMHVGWRRLGFVVFWRGWLGGGGQCAEWQAKYLLNVLSTIQSSPCSWHISSEFVKQTITYDHTHYTKKLGIPSALP